MVDKSKDETYKASEHGETPDFYETVRENYIKIVDELAKVQPQYSQSVSNLQLDYIQAIKNTIYTAFSAQKHLTNSNRGTWNSTPSSVPFIDQFAKQSNEITNNTIRAVYIRRISIILAFFFLFLGSHLFYANSRNSIFFHSFYF